MKSILKKTKKAFVVLAAALILVSVWVFVAPQKAEAANLTSQTQGNYTFSVYFKRAGGSLDNKKAEWGTSQNDNCCIAIRYRGDNGYASSTSTTADYWNGERGYDWHYSGTVSGFPDGIFGHINENNALRDAKLFIHGFKVNGIQVWSGMKDMISSTDDHYAYWYAKYYPSGNAMGTWSNNCNDGDTNDTNIWWQPHPTSTFTGSTTVYTDGSTTSTYGVTKVIDQYNVNWGFNSIQWVSSNSNATITNGGVATFGNNGGTDYDVTFTPKYVSNSATVSSDNGITVHVVTAKKLDVNGYVYTVAKDSGANDGGLASKAKAKVYIDNSVHSSGNNVNDFYSDVKYNRTYKIEVTPIAGWKMAGIKDATSGVTYTTSTNTDSNITVTGSMPTKGVAFRFAMRPKVIKLTLNNQSATSAGTAAVYYKYQQNAAQDTSNTSSTGTYFTSGNNSNNTVTGVISSITVPSRTGYTFGGYYSSANGGGTQYINANGGFVNNAYSALTADTTLYAKWTANTYTVAYNGNGSNGGSTANSSHTYDAAKNLTANGFTRKFTVTYDAATNGGTCGTANATATATFNGWATSASGAKVYNNSQSVTNLTATNGATVTLYAKWTDGSVTLPSATKAYDDTYHYAFDGWYDAQTGGTKIGNAGASYTPSANKTLYAHYTATAHSYTDSVTSQATCTDAGVTKHTCTCGRTYNTNTPAALGHSWGTAAYTWNGFACSASRTCGRNSAHNETENATVTNAVTTEPTCTGQGVKTYTATFTNSAFSQQTKTETLSALGHSWGTAAYTWNGFACSASRTCGRNSAHNETENATVTNAVTTAATCTDTGVRTYTATFGNAAFSTQTKTETVAKDPNNHASYGQTLDAATASEPTYDADGYTGDTKCDGCHAVRAAGERIPKLTELIELPDVSLEDTGLTGVCSISPSVHESDISYEIVGFAGTGSHTLYKAANKPNDGTSLKLKNARIWKTSDSAFGYRFSSMDFTNLESFYVLVKVSGTNLHKYAVSDVYTYEKITLVPPKNVLFDDASPAISFANSQTTDSGYGVWKRINDSGSEIETSFDQFDDPATAKSSYGDSIRYSLGDAHQVSVSDTIPVKNGPTAQFTFTGSAFDVISVTDSSSGVFVVSVYAGASATGEPIEKKTVDTYYGYTYSQVYYNPLNDRVVDGENPHGTYLYAALDTTPDADKIYNDFGTVFYTRNETYAVKDDQGNPKPAYGWVLSSGDNAMYQVPALSVDMGAVGQYTVVIQPRFTVKFGHYNEDAEGVKYFNFTFDGVRIYNPADGNNAALAKYAANGETYTNYRLIRDEISAADMVVIDGSERLQGMQLAAYIQGTPNEELYLMPNGTTGFDVDISGLTDARIGLRAANGTACTVTVGNGSGTTRTITVGSATEQYYSVKDLIPTGTTTGTITLTNGNSGILSVTKLMTTSNTAPASPSQAPRRISVSPQTAEAALATVRMLNADIAIHEESVQAQTGSDGTVTLTLTTGADAETVVIRDAEGNVIDPDSVTFTITDSGEKNWTVTFTEAREGTFTYTLQAEYENGYTGSAEPTEATVTVSFNTDPTGEDSTGTDPTGEELLGGLSDILAKLRNIFDILREFIRTIAALFR